jgi:hypothetical protein
MKNMATVINVILSCKLFSYWVPVLEASLHKENTELCNFCVYCCSSSSVYCVSPVCVEQSLQTRFSDLSSVRGLVNLNCDLVV